MKVTFIHHSSFLVETASVLLLFDYFQGELPDLDPEKTLYVLTSHSHGDHYGKIIFSLPEKHPDVRYILSSDIPSEDVPSALEPSVSFLAPHENYADEYLKVFTLRSNDVGVAFVCEADGLKIYHGGDLNNWYWDRSEMTFEYERAYHAELKLIEGQYFDAAFIPLDPRLMNYHIGIDNFMEHASSKAIFPMHFWGNFDLISEFLELPGTASYRRYVMQIKENGQVFSLSHGDGSH